MGAPVPFLDLPEIPESIHAKVSRIVHVDEVNILFVPPNNPVNNPTNGVICKDTYLFPNYVPTKPNRAGKALWGSGKRFDHFIRSQRERLDPELVLDFDLVDFVISPDQHGDRTLVGLVKECLDQLIGAHVKKDGHCLNRLHIWRAYPLHLLQ